MINQKHRLNSTRISLIFNKGRKATFTYFMIRFLPNHKAFNRYSIVISKKNVKKAVLRNFYRRQIFEILRKNDYLFKQGYDFLINIHPKLLKQNFDFKKQQLIESICNIPNINHEK